MKAFAPWFTGMNGIDFRKKDDIVRSHISEMIVRCTQMFKYDGLPQTIPSYILEQMIQCNGHCIITKANGELYAFTGGYGNEPDVYYRGTKYIVANPYLNINNEYTIDKDCILCRNDHMVNGLMPIHRRYSTLLAENELSMKMAIVLSRLQLVFTGSTDNDKLSADDVIRGLENGNLSAVTSSDFLGGIAVQPGASFTPQTMQQLIETEQFIKASWYNELGLDSNYNLKRESLNSAEIEQNSDALLPLIDDMIECRKDFTEKVNAMYGTNITVDYNSSWKDNQEQINGDIDETGKDSDNSVDVN